MIKYLIHIKDKEIFPSDVSRGFRDILAPPIPTYNLSPVSRQIFSDKRGQKIMETSSSIFTLQKACFASNPNDVVAKSGI